MDVDAIVAKNIAEHGWHVMMVYGTVDDPGPTFAYTIGLHESYGHAEVLVSGLDDDPRFVHRVLNGIGNEVRDGRTYAPLTASDGILAGHACWFLPVHPDRYHEVVVQAVRHYGGTAFPVVQLVWPSTKGVFPWDPDIDPAIASLQELWVDPPPDAH